MKQTHRLRHHSNRPTLSNLNPVFHRREASEDDEAVPTRLIKRAHETGVLNLAGRGLTSVPEKVYTLNEGEKNVEVSFINQNTQEAWWNQLALTNLDLSSNMLNLISPKIEQLESLTILSLHDNALTFIPKEIGKLEKLTRINLSRNRLNELPAEFFALPNLRHLSLSHNNFEELSPAITDLHMLEFLDLSNNHLLSLPEGIGFLVRVTQLLASYNHITELPSDLVNMRSLQKLDLMHNNLIKLPEDMGSLRKLQFLYAQHNDIVVFPDFDGCEELHELHLANNFIEELPKHVCSQLPHLKLLDLRENKIVQLPVEIARLQSLTRLDLSNNSISNLPLGLGSLPHLVSLQVEGNPIKSIRRDILQCGTTRILKTLRDRASAEGNPTAPALNTTTSSSNASDMAGDGLNSPRRPCGYINEDPVYPDKYQLRKTHSLTVNLQNIEAVPDEVFRLAMEENVSYIDFSKNALHTLPNGLQMLCHCASDLVFANNKINTIPGFISQFTRLTQLNFSCNNLCDLPKEIALLKTLRELNISYNRFELLPDCVYELKSLEILMARNNRIKCIDATENGLGGIKRLARLDLANNNITHVPPILGNLKNIVNLEIIGNPFRNPRHQVLEKGTEAIMSYLRDRIPV